MSGAFVCIAQHHGKPVVQVTIGKEHKRYTLTKAGCLAAGRELHQAGVESWLNSSSVDFPEEVKPGCRLDIRKLLNEGFLAEQERIEAPRRRLIEKMLDWCKKPEFQATLDDEERAEFKKLRTEA